MATRLKSIFVILVLLLKVSEGTAQETVFSLLKSDAKLADTYFANKDYQKALSLYRNAAKKKPSKEIDLKIARSHLFLKQYHEAVTAFEKYAQRAELPTADVYNYAEAQSGISNYERAIEMYQSYLSRVPDDEHAMKKVWRLNNKQFLFEDSSHYEVNPINVNTSYGEISAKPYKDGLVFVSNRKGIRPIEKIDAFSHASFYKMFFSAVLNDTLQSDSLIMKSPVLFSRDFNSRFHMGPFTFYMYQTKMVFTSTASKKGKDGSRTLQLYFAENNGGRWKIVGHFPYNSSDYSVSDPWISPDGTILYFSSDMKGGFGKKDIYRSRYKDGQWSKPENVGEFINTKDDETFPFLFQNTLYFASNGHAGLGGLDIYRADGDGNIFSEPQNMGYPLNTNYDDFALSMDSLGNHGYFSSNRRRGGYDDDVFEFDMDLQTFPLQITGVMKIKDQNWSNQELRLMPNAKIQLIDNHRNITVFEHTCDASGNFSITIPYYSKYKLKVIGEDGIENVVSLELSKHRKEHDQHEIVVVKDIFKSN